ncbi:hypothetical protein T265_10784 [Opisthorchis viverrini]|uniref:Reverse transcriptase domain-containing protein n=1 Tax=Opisthorchis viverrini TaxID=6198 RepID=A0A074Z119_OPIVI|nr:hypothetical protein T265_10784 [Opisthorchis viverrini]KER20731.1 hypothetical protein T265_10784 [Opisthorchis viverrini]
MPVVTRLLLSLILRRLMAAREVLTRFRPGRGCIDQIFTLRQVLEQRHTDKRPIILVFLNFQAAFDMVDRSFFLTRLPTKECPRNDIVLIFEEEVKAEVFLDELTEIIPSFGMHLASTKCKVVLWNIQSLNTPLTIQGEALEVVERFTYLGFISSDYSMPDEISTRICKTRAAFANLRHLCRQNGLSLNRKGRVYQATVRDVLLCGCETAYANGGTETSSGVRQSLSQNCSSCWVGVGESVMRQLESAFSVVQWVLPLKNVSSTRNRVGWDMCCVCRTIVCPTHSGGSGEVANSYPIRGGMKEITKRLGAVGATRLSEWGPRDPNCTWLETLQDMASTKSLPPSTFILFSTIRLANKSMLYDSEALVLNTDVMLSMTIMMMICRMQFTNTLTPSTTSHASEASVVENLKTPHIIYPKRSCLAPIQQHSPYCSLIIFCTQAEIHTDPALPPAVRCCSGREACPAQDWPIVQDACRFGIKPRSDWSKVWTQEPIMTQYWPNAVADVSSRRLSPLTIAIADSRGVLGTDSASVEDAWSERKRNGGST